MRGKVLSCSSSIEMTRITPAYAGKSWAMLRTLYRLRDHPRLCGEKFSGIWENIKSVGSPPPMRGKAAEKNSERRRDRITPAYAGKSFRNSTISTLHQDHPRLCGEKGLQNTLV